MAQKKLITNDRIAPGNVIVGLSSFGKATYEKEYNSGIGSNGLTSARHDFFDKVYADKYPESYDPALSNNVVYIGKHRLTDPIDITGFTVDAGKLVLSPTRTFAPIIKKVLDGYFENIFGIIHNSGGGQTKCLKYLPGPMRIVKDNLFTPPPVFQLIREASGSDEKEMFQVFNMGCRMEIYTDEQTAGAIIAIASSFDVDAQIIGRVEPSMKKELEIKMNDHSFTFTT